ncbi:hypothetical protein C1H46_016821 [Malus baccata]|uniref:Uncharacterized protein n=1 Tax=Malus baccata TaxID=106549 RepID=A0A540MFQ4_MALBA|nr:hypothetical protein C1H46_016821 [Malus baccata]
MNSPNRDGQERAINELERFNSLHSRVTRTSPNCISLTSWWVETERSRRRVGLVERRSWWMQTTRGRGGGRRLCR